MSLQATLGLSLVKSGALQLTTGFIWGVLIPIPPYPRIALSAHLNIIQHGLLSIAAGLIVGEGLASYSDWQIWTIAGAHFGLWALDIIGGLNSWWGTNRSFKMVWFRGVTWVLIG
jgi:hydroxylaminobenzene mutase